MKQPVALQPNWVNQNRRIRIQCKRIPYTTGVNKLAFSRQIAGKPGHMQQEYANDKQTNSQTKADSSTQSIENEGIAAYAMWTETFGNFISAVGSNPSLNIQTADGLNNLGNSIQAVFSGVVADTETFWNINKAGNMIYAIGITEEIAATVLNIENQTKKLLIFIQGNLLRLLGVGLSAIYSLELAPTLPNLYGFYGNAIGLSGIFFVIISEVIQLRNKAQATGFTGALNAIGNWIQVAGAAIAALGQSLTFKEAAGQYAGSIGSCVYATRNRPESPYY